MAIDFVSTRTGVDPQTAACARLLASVIADAVREISRKPTQSEMLAQRNIDGKDELEAEVSHPGLSAKFLFDDNSPFLGYARLIGLNPHEFRRSLLEKDAPDPLVGARMKPLFNRRAIRIRHRFYLLEKYAEQEATTNKEQ